MHSVPPLLQPCENAVVYIPATLNECIIFILYTNDACQYKHKA